MLAMLPENRNKMTVSAQTEMENRFRQTDRPTDRQTFRISIGEDIKPVSLTAREEGNDVLVELVVKVLVFLVLPGTVVYTVLLPEILLRDFLEDICDRDNIFLGDSLEICWFRQLVGLITRSISKGVSA